MLRAENASSRGPGRSLGLTLASLFFLAGAALWSIVFATALWTFPRHANRSNTAEVQMTATYLPGGKSRLGLTAADGEMRRHRCDPLAPLCRFVMAHSPVVLRVRTAGPRSGLSDTAVLSARADEVVLVTDAEGQENLASLQRTYLGGLASTIVGLLLAAWLLLSGAGRAR
jgi:hypothetical protein